MGRKQRVLKPEQMAEGVKVGDVLGVEAADKQNVFYFYKVLKVNLHTYKVKLLEQEVVNLDYETVEVRATDVIKQGVLYKYGITKGLLVNKSEVAAQDVGRTSFVMKLEPVRYR
jgi:hypothetical protein